VIADRIWGAADPAYVSAADSVPLAWELPRDLLATLLASASQGTQQAERMEQVPPREIGLLALLSLKLLATHLQNTFPPAPPPPPPPLPGGVAANPTSSRDSRERARPSSGVARGLAAQSSGGPGEKDGPASGRKADGRASGKEDGRASGGKDGPASGKVDGGASGGERCLVTMDGGGCWGAVVDTLLALLSGGPEIVEDALGGALVTAAADLVAHEAHCAGVFRLLFSLLAGALRLLLALLAADPYLTSG
ncbi:hypothetical protein T484DRAFT_1831642, partial [Baffinella frigidus]